MSSTAHTPFNYIDQRQEPGSDKRVPILFQVNDRTVTIIAEPDKGDPQEAGALRYLAALAARLQERRIHHGACRRGNGRLEEQSIDRVSVDFGDALKALRGEFPDQIIAEVERRDKEYWQALAGA